MTVGQDFSIAAGWGLAGLVSSVLVLTVCLPGPPAAADRALTERVVHSLDRQSCQRALRAFVAELGSADPAAWLWTEESGAWDGPVVLRTKRLESAAPPRPYAFRPGDGDIPEQACAFQANSIHVVSRETVAPPTVFAIISQIE